MAMLLFSGLMSGCTLVSTYRYVHEPTEEIRAGFLDSQYFKKASDALPTDLKGVLLVPDFSHRKSSRANLRGLINIVARTDHTVTIETITLHDSTKSLSHVIKVGKSIELKPIHETNLWYEKIALEIPADKFKNLSALYLDVEWRENDSNSVTTTVFTLNGKTHRSIAFAR